MSEKQKQRIEAKIKNIEEQNPLYEYLKHIDAESVERIHPNDEYRIRRAIEIFLLTGKPITHHRRQIHKKQKQKGYTFVGLTMERELLYMRIDQRVEEMVRRGFIEEVDHLLKLGYDRELGAFHAPGYNEFLKYLGGALTREEAIEETKRKTRNYAKRQFTWFRKIHEAQWFDVTEGYKSTVEQILALFRKAL
jgi:tRNA dimethylallyltransferase